MARAGMTPVPALPGAYLKRTKRNDGKEELCNSIPGNSYQFVHAMSHILLSSRFVRIYNHSEDPPMIRVVLAIWTLVATSLFAQDNTARIDNLLRDYTERRGFVGTVVVAENGSVVYGKGFGLADREHGLPNGTQIHYRIASVTKTFVSTMIMKLVEQGKVNLRDPIRVYLPTYRRDIADRVTVHQLLTHSSGIPDYVSSAAWRSHAAEPMPSIDYLVQTYCSDSLAFEPGSAYAYSNSGYVLLGAIIQKVTGMTFEQALQEMILKPAGMSQSGLDCSGLDIPARAVGYDPGFSDDRAPVENWNIEWVFAPGGMYATPEDMVKWDQILYDNAFITRPSVRLMSTPYFSTSQTRRGFSYGYGFVVSRRVRSRDGDSLLVMSHDGGMPGFNSSFSRIPATRQMVFIASNASNAPLLAITDGIFSILNGFDPAPVKKSLAWELYRAINAKGLAAGLQEVESKRYANPSDFDVSEREVNTLGQEYLKQKKLQESEAVLGLNVREFPRSWSAYHSMGECYGAMGEKTKAITFYQKSVEMNPQNTDAKEALRSLGESVTK